MSREILRPKTKLTPFVPDPFRETSPLTAGVIVSWAAVPVAIRLRALTPAWLWGQGPISFAFVNPCLCPLHLIDKQFASEQIVLFTACEEKPRSDLLQGGEPHPHWNSSSDAHMQTECENVSVAQPPVTKHISAAQTFVQDTSHGMAVWYPLESHEHPLSI